MHEFFIRGIPVLAYDAQGSQSAQWIAWELEADAYRLEHIAFSEGDVVIDIGAHVGLFSIYLAKRWPGVTVYAFEPFPDNFANCLENLRMNQIANVQLSPRAIGGSPRRVSMAASRHNTGGASAIKSTFGHSPIVRDIETITLDEVFSMHAIDRCKLLKIDCEGMEFEILPQAGVLDRVEYLSGEFHHSTEIARGGWTPTRLHEFCGSQFEKEKLTVVFNELCPFGKAA